MMPRQDRETAPVAAGVQLIKRPETDRYGTDRAHWGTIYRPVVTRNGLPVRLYVYRGTGQSMSADEAEWWLTA